MRETILEIKSFGILCTDGVSDADALMESLDSAGLRPTFLLNVATECRTGENDQIQIRARRWNVPYQSAKPNSNEARRFLNNNAIDTWILVGDPGPDANLLDANCPPIVKLQRAPLPAYRGEHATEWAL